MVDYHDNRTETIHEINAISGHAVNIFSAPRTLPVGFHEIRARLASRNNDRDFEVQERLFLQIPQPGPSNDGDLANLSSDNEKGLNVVIAGR